MGNDMRNEGGRQKLRLHTPLVASSHRYDKVDVGALFPEVEDIAFVPVLRVIRVLPTRRRRPGPVLLFVLLYMLYKRLYPRQWAAQGRFLARLRVAEVLADLIPMRMPALHLSYGLVDLLLNLPHLPVRPGEEAFPVTIDVDTRSALKILEREGADARVGAARAEANDAPGDAGLENVR